VLRGVAEDGEPEVAAAGQDVVLAGGLRIVELAGGLWVQVVDVAFPDAAVDLVHREPAGRGRLAARRPRGTTSGVALQLGTTTSGVNDLVTGATAGARAGANDVDDGVTTVRSPAISLPSTGTLTLSLQWYLAHLNNSSSVDFFRVNVIGTTTTTVFQQLGATADLSVFAGQTTRIQIEAADAATASLVEAGVDDVRITRQL